MNRNYLCLSFVLLLSLNQLVLAQTNIDLSHVQGVGISQDTVQLSNIRVDIVTENPSDKYHPQVDSVYYNVAFKLDPVTLNLVPILPCANSQIQVTDLKEGAPIAYAQVTVEQSGIKAIVLETNERGWVFFNNLLPGPALVTVNKEHYIFFQKKIDIVCGDSHFNVPLESRNQIRIILDWGNIPRDLDAHLTGPHPGVPASYNNEPDRFHVYFSNKQALGNTVVLETNDFNTNKPESVAIYQRPETNQLTPGVYRFIVHNFSQEGDITAPGVVVKLWINNDSPEQVFTPTKNKENQPNDRVNVWVVFELLVTEEGIISTVPIQRFEFIDVPNKVV